MAAIDDTGAFNISVRLPQGTSYERTAQFVAPMEKDVLSLPFLQRASFTVNPGSANFPLILVPLEEIMQTCPVVLTGRSFSGARVQYMGKDMLDRKSYKIYLDLTGEGSSRYWQYSKGRDGERLAFVLNGEVMTCPRIKHMKVGTLEIDPIWVEADAQKLADFINNQK